jgi:hypothetical protein
VGAHKADSSPKEIEDELGHSRGLYAGPWSPFIHATKVILLSRSGTPLKYTSRARRRMLQYLRSHPKMSYEKRGEATGLKMSDLVYAALR